MSVNTRALAPFFYSGNSSTVHAINVIPADSEAEKPALHQYTIL